MIRALINLPWGSELVRWLTKYFSDSSILTLFGYTNGQTIARETKHIKILFCRKKFKFLSIFTLA